MKRMVQATHDHAEYTFKPLSFQKMYICALSGVLEHWKALTPYCGAVLLWTLACVAPLHQTQWLHGLPVAMLMALPTLVFIVYAAIITMRALACGYVKTTVDWQILAKLSLTDFPTKVVMMFEVIYKRLLPLLGLAFLIMVGAAMGIGMVLGFIVAAFHGAFRQNLAMVSVVYGFAFITMLKIAAIPVFATTLALTSMLLPTVVLTHKSVDIIDPRFQSYITSTQPKQRLFQYGLVLFAYAIVQWLIFWALDTIVNPNTGILLAILWTLLTAIITVALGAVWISANTLFFLDFFVRYEKLTSDVLEEDMAHYSIAPVDPWATH